MAYLARIHRLTHFITATEIGRFTLMLVAPLMMCGEEYLLKCWKFIFQKSV